MTHTAPEGTQATGVDTGHHNDQNQEREKVSFFFHFAIPTEYTSLIQLPPP
jgi:hypothetical protein